MNIAISVMNSYHMNMIFRFWILLQIGSKQSVALPGAYFLCLGSRVAAAELRSGRRVLTCRSNTSPSRSLSLFLFFYIYRYDVV